MTDRKKMEGEVVVFVDENSQEHLALITRDFGSAAAPKESTSVNLVYVASNEERTDSYGRQIQRATSVPHQTSQAAPGYFWKDLAE